MYIYMQYHQYDSQANKMYLNCPAHTHTHTHTPACTAELMKIGPSYHEQPGASMLVLSDMSSSSTWSAGYINIVHLHQYTPCITCTYYIWLRVLHLYIYILLSVYMNMLYKCSLDFHIQYQQRHFHIYTHYLGSGQMCNQLYTGVARIRFVPYIKHWKMYWSGMLSLVMTI